MSQRRYIKALAFVRKAGFGLRSQHGFVNLLARVKVREMLAEMGDFPRELT
jgi:hypothetical protein